MNPLGKCSATCRGCAASAWDELGKPRNLGRLRYTRRRFSWFQGVATRHENSSGNVGRSKNPSHIFILLQPWRNINLLTCRARWNYSDPAARPNLIPAATRRPILKNETSGDSYGKRFS